MLRNRRGRHPLGVLIALPLAAIALSGATAGVAAEPLSPTLALTPSQGPAGTSLVAGASGFNGCTSGTFDGVSPETPGLSSPPPTAPSPVTQLGPAARRPKTPTGLTALRLPTGPPGTVAFFWDGAALGSSPVDPDGTATATFDVPNPSTTGIHHVEAQCVENPKLVTNLADFEVTLTPPPTKSASPPPVTTVVPDLVGMTHDAAEATLRSRHLTLGTTTGPGDRVERQDPAAGTRVAPGTAVDVAFAAAISNTAANTAATDDTTPWIALVAGCALLLALLLAGLAGYRVHRVRTSHRWVRAHVKVVAAQAQGRPDATAQHSDADGPPTTAVALQSHIDAGSPAVEETKV
jgi:hypothetical protein